MKYLKDLKYKLMDELEEYSPKGDLSGGDLEMVHKLTDTIKNIDKICMLEEDGYSNTGGRYMHGDDDMYARSGRWEAEGEYGMDDYSGRRHRDSRGRYTRDGGSTSRYSRGGGDMKEHMMRMMGKMRDPEDKEEMRRFIESM